MRQLARLWRFPALALAVAGAAALLALTTASAPLFIAGAGGDLFQRFSTEDPLGIPAVTIATDSFTSYEMSSYRDELLQQALGPLVGAATASLGGEVIGVEGGGRSDPGRLMSRTGARDQIEILEEIPGRGVWLADYTADRIGVEVGDRVALSPGLGDPVTGVRVVAIYRDLAEDPITSYWAPISEFIYPAPGANTRPPVPVLTDERTFFQLANQMGDDITEYRWDFVLPRQERSLDQAEALAAALYETNLRLSDPSNRLGSAFPNASFESAVEAWVAQTRDAVASITGPVGSLSMAGRAVALAALAGAGVFMVRRRKVEYDIFIARGIAPWRLAIRSGLEMLLPVVLGAAVGWAAAIRLVRDLGPQGPLVRPELIDSAFLTAGTIAVGLLLAGVAVAVSVRSSADGSGRLAGITRRFAWEPVVLALAAASFYEISTRGRAVTAASEGALEVDALLLVFPLLFIVGTAGLLMRGVFRLLPRLRTRGRGLGPSLYLALRRLTHGSAAARSFVTAAAIAIGVFVFAGVMSSSTQLTAGQEAALFTGGDVRVNVAQLPSLSNADFEHTSVVRLGSISVDGGGEGRAELLGVDRDTFAATAYWREEFGPPLQELLARIGDAPTEEVPVLVSGEGVTGDRLFLGGYAIPFEVRVRARALPGALGDNAVVIADRTILERAFDQEGSSLLSLAGGYEVWASGAPRSEVVAALEAEGASVREAISVDEVRATPDYLALTWTFDFLEALGLVTSGVVLIGCLLFLQARQRRAEAAYAIARRMGLSPRAHRASVAFELVGMLALSAVTGSLLAIGAAALTHSRLELGGLGQVPLFEVPTLPLVSLALALACFSGLCALVVQRRADSADVSQVMRYGS